MGQGSKYLVIINVVLLTTVFQQLCFISFYVSFHILFGFVYPLYSNCLTPFGKDTIFQVLFFLLLWCFSSIASLRCCFVLLLQNLLVNSPERDKIGLDHFDYLLHCRFHKPHCTTCYNWSIELFLYWIDKAGVVGSCLLYLVWAFSSSSSGRGNHNFLLQWSNSVCLHQIISCDDGFPTCLII